MKTFCFDMDGVICNIDSDNYLDRSPIKETIELINSLSTLGSTIVIHTGRHFNHMKDTKTWLENNFVIYDYLQMGKPVADVYIDDKALRFDGKWTNEKLKQLR